MESVDRPVIDEPVKNFLATEAFFSRTDKRGVIQSGNSVFVRLSEYEWSALAGAPHRIIRHPDMPKSVFKLMWDIISAGETFGGFVKNRAASGRYYWVFAIVIPTETGFLSVRIKPSGKIFEATQDLYKELIRREHQEGYSAETAQSYVLEPLSRLGYENYQRFMTDALSEEISIREDLATPSAIEKLEQFSEVSSRLIKLHELVKRVETLFEDFKAVPLNLHLVGTRLGSAGHAVRAVASNYADISKNLMESIASLGSNLSYLTHDAYAGRMGFCSAVMIKDAIDRFSKEPPVESSVAHAGELKIIAGSLGQFDAQTIQNCKSIKEEANRFADLNNTLRKSTLALGLTRITCSIESAVLGNLSEDIDTIADQLQAFQTRIDDLLDEIILSCAQISHAVPTLKPSELSGNL